jgi:hypothetical protein
LISSDEEDEEDGVYAQLIIPHAQRVHEVIPAWRGKTAYDADMNQSVLLSLMEALADYNAAHEAHITHIYGDGVTLARSTIMYYRSYEELGEDISAFRRDCFEELVTYGDLNDAATTDDFWQQREVRFRLGNVWSATVQTLWEDECATALVDPLSPIGRVLHPLKHGVLVYTEDFARLHGTLCDFFHHLLDRLPAPYNAPRANYPHISTCIAHYRYTVNQLRILYQRHMRRVPDLRARFVAYAEPKIGYEERLERFEIIELLAPCHAYLTLVGATRLICVIDGNYLMGMCRDL